MRNLLLSCLAALFCFGSCTKQAEVKPNDLDYYPTSKNSLWEYGWSNNISSINSTYQVLGDTMLDGKQYAMLGNTGDSYPVLVRKENGKYYRRVDSYGSYSDEMLFLQDNLPVGGTWTDQEVSELKTVYTIVAIDERRAIGGKEYNHTLEVKTESFYYVPNKNDYNLSHTSLNIYAKGVGLVEVTGDQSRSILTKYEIK